MKDKQINVRVSIEEKNKIETKAKEMGFRNVSEYLRFLGVTCSKLEMTFETEQKDGLNYISSSKTTMVLK